MLPGSYIQLTAVLSEIGVVRGSEGVQRVRLLQTGRKFSSGCYKRLNLSPASYTLRISSAFIKVSSRLSLGSSKISFHFSARAPNVL